MLGLSDLVSRGHILDFTANKIWTAQKIELLIKFENLYLTRGNGYY